MTDLTELQKRIDALPYNADKLSVLGAYNNLYKRGYTDTFIPFVAEFYKNNGCEVVKHGVGTRHTIKMTK